MNKLENNVQYGPYSPQEADRVSKWLKTESIQFEILRNDQEARESLMNDGQNLVNLADLRTGIYLAQIFYFNLSNLSESQKAKFESLFTPKIENFPKQQELDPAVDTAMLQKSNLQNQYKKRSWAMFLAFLIILQIVIALYNIYFKES